VSEVKRALCKPAAECFVENSNNKLAAGANGGAAIFNEYIWIWHWARRTSRRDGGNIRNKNPAAVNLFEDHLGNVYVTSNILSILVRTEGIIYSEFSVEHLDGALNCIAYEILVGVGWVITLPSVEHGV
jgi:hypothetical protein